MEYDRPLHDEPGGMLIVPISPENWEKLRAYRLVRGLKIDQWFEKVVNATIAKW